MEFYYNFHPEGIPTLM